MSSNETPAERRRVPDRRTTPSDLATEVHLATEVNQGIAQQLAGFVERVASVRRERRATFVAVCAVLVAVIAVGCLVGWDIHDRHHASKSTRGLIAQQGQVIAQQGEVLAQQSRLLEDVESVTNPQAQAQSTANLNSLVAHLIVCQDNYVDHVVRGKALLASCPTPDSTAPTPTTTTPSTTAPPG